MKPKKISRKLNFVKKTIADLSSSDLQNHRAGQLFSEECLSLALACTVDEINCFLSNTCSGNVDPACMCPWPQG